jgi:penicillin-binding protein 2
MLSRFGYLRIFAILFFGLLISLPACLGAAPAPRDHHVRRGETLFGIARHYGVSVAALAAANGMSPRSTLHVGATLVIPGDAQPARAAKRGETSPAPRQAARQAVSYRVHRGDTLASIANRFNVGVAQLRAWNRLNTGRIFPGDRLNIYGYRTGKIARTGGRVPVYADSERYDDADYDDPVVRQAAVEALGRYNGSVVAVDPNTGRILTIVNQPLAFSSGFIPCSTIKPVIAVAALEQGIITRDSMVQVAPHRYLNLVEALAHSNNAFFEALGRRLGFDTVSRYARLLGLGELAGYGIPEEQPGTVPSEPPKDGGVARMSSFGQGIEITPLQLASLASTLANGGIMYYLQYPRSKEASEHFVPRIKRRLDIEALLPDIRDGMLAAVLYGTARLSYVGEDEQPLGKTGTCSEYGGRVGWFVSYADQAHPKIVLVVLMRGSSHRINGPMAAGIAGRIYRRLYGENFFAEKPAEPADPSGAYHTVSTGGSGGF